MGLICGQKIAFASGHGIVEVDQRVGLTDKEVIGGLGVGKTGAFLDG